MIPEYRIYYIHTLMCSTSDRHEHQSIFPMRRNDAGVLRSHHLSPPFSYSRYSTERYVVRTIPPVIIVARLVQYSTIGTYTNTHTHGVVLCFLIPLSLIHTHICRKNGQHFRSIIHIYCSKSSRVVE